MYVYLFVLTVITIVIFLLFLKTLISKNDRPNLYYLIGIVIIIIGWAYYLLPSTPNVDNFMDLDTFIITSNNYKISNDEKVLLQSILEDTKLYKVPSEASFDSLGGLQDTVIFIDTPKGKLQFYLQPDLDNYDHVVYNGLIYKLKDSMKYYNFLDELGY